MDREMADLCIRYMNEFVDFHGYRHAKKVTEHILNLLQAESDGRLFILTLQDIHPCNNCNTGWSSISSKGSDGCEKYCKRLKEYNEKYSK